MGGRITKAERIEAEIIAARMLSCRARPRDVKKRLAEKFEFSRSQATSVISAVQKSWAEQAEATKAEILAETFRTLDEATALAFTQKRPDNVVRSERLRAELAGLLGSEVRLVVPPKDASEDDDKSELQLRCLATMGKDPGELSEAELERFVARLREDGDEVMAKEAQSSGMLN